MRTNSVHGTVNKDLFSHLRLPPPHFREEEIETVWFQALAQGQMEGGRGRFQVSTLPKKPGIS